MIVAWALTGPIFHFSDTWQLVINTGTTIVTFLMVFLIQNTQNRDAKAIQLKLDELIRSKRGARNSLVDLENCTDEELEEMERELRTTIPATIRKARELGDLRENAEYHSAKLKQANVSRRVAALQLKLARARFVEDVEFRPGVVGLGTNRLTSEAPGYMPGGRVRSGA